MPNSGLDAVDCRIVAELQSNGRLSNVELADKIGLSPSPCLRRVKRVELDGHTNERALEFEKAVIAMPEIVACHLVSGEADYFLEVVVPDLRDYQRFLVDKLLNMPIVREVRSNIAIQTLKAGALLPLQHLAPEPSQRPPQAARPGQPEQGRRR